MSGQWRVARRGAPPVIVRADYFVVDAGNLIFRVKGRADVYPHCVRLFAAGAWADVEACDNEQTPSQ